MSTPSGAKNRRGGFTLLEVLVAAFLSALVLHVIVTLLIPSLKLSALGTTRVDLDGRAGLLEKRLITALRRTCRSGIKVYEPTISSVVLSTHPLEGTVADSAQQWGDYLDTFVWRDAQVIEWSVPVGKSSQKAIVLPENELLSALNQGQRKFAIRDVTEFHVKVADGPAVDFGFTLKKDQDTLEVQRTVFLVNSSQ